MLSHQKVNLEYCLKIDVQSAKRRFVFFLGLVGSLGILTMFYDGGIDYGFLFIGLYAIAGALGGVLLLFDVIKYPPIIGFMLSSSIYIHAVFLLTDIFYKEETASVTTWLSALIWFAFGYSFSLNWHVMIEPYFEGYQQLVSEEQKEESLLSSLRPKKNPPCIGCRKIETN